MNKVLLITVPKKELKLSRNVSEREASLAYAKGFYESAKPKLKTKYAGYTGFRFKFV